MPEFFGALEIGAVAGAIMAIIGLVTWVTVTIKNALQPLQAIQAALKGSLRYSITRAHREYTRENKISNIALSSLCDMYEQYKKLGGNGYTDTLMRELNHLPIEPDYRNSDVAQ